MDKDLGQVFTELKDDLTAFVELKVEFLKLTAYERAGKWISSLSYVLALVVLGIFAAFFIFLALGFQIGEWLNSTSAGIAIVGGIYLLVIGILIMNKKWFTGKLTNSIIAALDDEENEPAQTSETIYEGSAEDTPGTAS
ncbi:cytochrome c biogenesis protein CcdA [Parabacteroides sp. PFB2-12]|uniref:phage holin family protein n=1 Tax=unclassified Parabacteroides TaxID=2649774 RepID=UPI0024761D1B|nr:MULTISPECIES: phage holin family protein [unclassified Parabacteroides]MDH6342743.1 cytochrome c biogenesis protein CcdA [Parabacteroides sp. PM6-13]MDH6391489.1 cytochrome c biogenesis protein CcdA [Parabacteroides sp. PFB2-12]